MIEVTDKKEHISFSPGLNADDACANYWMRQVILRLRREICWCWHDRGVLSNSNSVAIPSLGDKVSAILDMSRFWEEKKKFYQCDPTARYLTQLLNAEPPLPDSIPIQGSFGWVVKRLNLDGISSFILALGLVVVFDNAVGKVVAACLNDQLKTRPNLALAQKLWDHPQQVLTVADPAHQLFRYGLLHRGTHPSHNYSELDWESPIIVPPPVAYQLLFPNATLPHGLTSIFSEYAEALGPTESFYSVVSRLRSKIGNAVSIVPVQGPRGSARVEIVREIAKITSREVVEFKEDLSLLGNGQCLNSLATLCWLRGLDLFLDQDPMSQPGCDKPGSEIPWRSLCSIPITIFWGITERSQLANIPEKFLLPILEVPEFSYQDRVSHWKKALGGKAKGLDSIILESSRRFRYEKETINAISQGLKGFSSSIVEKDFLVACRAEMDLDIGELAQKVVPRFGEEELILPHKQYLQFREIIKAMKSLTEVHYVWGTAKLWNESGIAVLFAGPPGTGKTMAAELLAIKLDLPMYRIDISQVVNKYIGETEKNLKRLFDIADISDAILFFDEADSIFGRRTEVKDAHDRYANLEISYLLERMERFKGLAILATNRKKDLDEAFLRRLRFILDFPLPGVEERKKIWRQVIPKKVDSSKLDFDFLSKQFQLAGGHIRSAVFNACLQSVNALTFGQPDFKGQLTMENIIIAVKREYDKINRSVSLEQFGPYAKIVERLEHENGKYRN